MKKRICTLISLISLVLLVIGTVACGKKTVIEETEKDIYSGTVLMNGFETTADMYKVRQHTYVQNDRWTGYSALGKLQIVGADNFIPVERDYQDAEVYKEEDMAPRQGEGALYVNYVSEIAEAGGFTQLIARFANSDLKDIPVDKLGGISVQIYNDNSSGRAVTLSLVKSDLSIVSFGENSVTLAPYAWTECKIDLNPAIVEYFQEDIIGLSVEFDSKNDSVYYLDNLCLSFEQISSEEIAEYVKLVKALEADIDEKVVNGTVSLDSKDILTDLFKRYLELPEEYQGIVRNYSDLETAITKYMSLKADEELSTTGSVALLRFDEIFGLTQVADGMGCSVSYTTEEHAPGEDGSLCVEFDGTMDWPSLALNPSVAVYDEIRVWVKNDSEFARIMNIAWDTLATTGGAAYDEDGNQITNDLSGVDYANNILGKGGWIQIVFRDEVNLANFNFASYNLDTRQVVKCQGKIYIGKVLATSIVGELMERIDAIEVKKSYTDEELLEIFDIYYAVLNLSKEQKNILGQDRVKKIEELYETNKTKILSVKINALEVKSEYTSAEINEVNGIKALYDELTKAEKQKVDATKLTNVLNKIKGYNTKGTNMDVTAYDSAYEEKLLYSVKEIYSGEAFSIKYQAEIKDGNFISITLPETITNAKRLKIAIKSTSDKTIAFWPKVSDEQGGLWLTSLDHEVTFNSEEGWVELVYDIEGLTIDSFLATYGPWENGKLEFYIGKVEVVTDMSKEVASEIAELAEMLNQNEFTAAEIQQVYDLKDLYDNLSSADKKKIDTTTLDKVLKKISAYDTAGKNMNVLAYESQYQSMLSYSLKEVLSGETFSMKISSTITNKDIVAVFTPETITGKQLKITVKNTSDKDIGFWPKGTDSDGETWLAPTNHDVVITKDEGWVELVYDIKGVSIDAFLATYGPWENGELELYIGKIEIVNSTLSIVQEALANISDILEQDEFTVEQIQEIVDVKAQYDELTASEKTQLDVTKLNVALEKISSYDSSNANMNITKYDSSYAQTLLYSVKETLEGENYSLKLDAEVGAGETVLALPEAIYGAKTVTITVKNTSEADIAFFPRLVDSQGGTWLSPTSHNGSYIISADEGWVELVYDIDGMTIDSIVMTLGPWQSGHLELYIGNIEVLTSYLSIVEDAIAGISSILSKEEFTAAEINQIMNVKEIYDSKLTTAEKETLNATDLLSAVEKIEGYDTAGTNMNVTKYDSLYSDIVYYSTKEKAEGAEFSLKLSQEMTTAEAYVTLPETIVGAKTMTIMVKNNSEQPVAFWPWSTITGGDWLLPTNHSSSPIITADEGWVELIYNIDGKNINTLITTLGPWAGGQMEFYIGGIEVSSESTTTLPQLPITGMSGGTYAQTADGIKVDFDGSMAWCDINFTTVTAGKEIHLFLKNDSDSARIVSLNWAPASKVLDENGNDVTASIVSNGNTVIPANSDWLEVVYTVTSANQINCTSLSGEAAMNSVGSLYIKGYSVDEDSSESTTTMSQLPITGMSGGTYAQTADGIKVDFDGSMTWCDINFTAVTAGKEIHLFLKNDSDSARIVSLNWKPASKVLNENGEDVTASIVSGDNTVIPANSGWLEVVYTITSASQINCTSLSGEAAINSVGSLYIKGYSVE